MTARLQGVGVSFRERQALADVTLTLASGEVLAVVGPNGSGKSTLLRALAGLVRHQGSIAWDNPVIGYMPQDNAIRAALTAFEVVLLGRLRSLSFRVADDDLRSAQAAMEELGIADFAPRRIGELSGGQRQLVFMAQVLAGDPTVLLLDEPTSALDIAHQLQVLALLRAVTHRRNLTTVVVLHDLNAAARHADRMALFDQGRLIEIGAPAAVLRPDRLKAAFGINSVVMTGPDGHPVVVPLGATAPG